MSRETWMPVAILLALAVVGAGIGSWWSSRQEAERIAQREARAQEREARELEGLARESVEMLGGVLPGVQLGQDIVAVQAARPRITRSDDHVDEGFELYDETLPTGAQAVYAFETEHGHLERVQLLSLLDDSMGIAPHLAAMQAQYGSPTGIWDCADGSGLRTRRFTWRGDHVGMADIVLIYGTRVSLTLYFTTNEQMASSLRRAGCRPTPPDAIDQFPTAEPAVIQQAQREQEEDHPR